MIFTVKNNPLDLEVIVILIVLGVLFGSIILVAIAQFIKTIIKHFRKTKKYKQSSDVNYLAIFGNDENIRKIEIKLQRVMIEVVNKELVNLELLKQLNIGVQITGNIYKCSSEAMVKALSETNANR